MTITRENDGRGETLYTYEEARNTFGTADATELSRELRATMHNATAGNVGQWAEDVGTGILVITSW